MNIFEQVAEMKAEEARKLERTRSSRVFVRNLLKNTDFSIEKIASLADVSIDFVRKIKVRSGK